MLIKFTLKTSMLFVFFNIFDAWMKLLTLDYRLSSFLGDGSFFRLIFCLPSLVTKTDFSFSSFSGSTILPYIEGSLGLYELLDLHYLLVIVPLFADLTIELFDIGLGKRLHLYYLIKLKVFALTIDRL